MMSMLERGSKEKPAVEGSIMMSEDDVSDVSSSVTKRMGVAATEAKTSGL